ncbi:FKBP-type peptidyl-prolyl cis-trans isomerase [Jatrophihabitans sp.]|uniref:FKBP-type peptidyl-prolyl cis-trans isomerase n=1 Tax=Jatrophihabitans sp. TaxID=1932789 RepID=UPI002BADCF83|nr:FKBP-type peptidyl-prolyl cis-trans isomerase [Jatrophihabitans sp.]
MPSRSRLLLATLTLPLVLLAACSSSDDSGSSAPSGSASGSPAASGAASGVSGVTVKGGFGTKPDVSIADQSAPGQLAEQVLSTGSGATVGKGDTLVANYSGQTWAGKDGKPNVFDSSFERGKPAAFVIGTGAVIPGWDKTLVGKRLGSRVLLSIPPADGYGSSGQPDAGISGTDTLVFVVDLVAAFAPDASAPGVAVSTLPAGLPKLTNVAGKPPTVLSTAGVKAPKKPAATLLVNGTGAPIEGTKTLVLQVVQTDLATGTKTESTWGKAPQTAPATNVLSVASALNGHKVGSRVLILTPPIAATPASGSQQAQPATPAGVLIVDVVGQF